MSVSRKPERVVITVKVPVKIREEVDDMAAALGITRSEMCEKVIRWGIKTKKIKPRP